MKIKKFLEKAAEEDREALINDRDVEFLASIGVDYEKKREAAKKEPDSSYYLNARTINYRALFSAIACFLVVAITAISLSLYFSLRSAPVESPIHYFDDNLVEADSNLLELNGDLQLFALTIDTEEYDVSIKRTYDSLSGDSLYFSLDFAAKKGLIKTFKLKVIVNKFYAYNGLSYTNELKEYQLADYILKYSETSQTMADTPFVTVNCKGEIQINEQSVYITEYEEMAMGQSTFIDTMKSIIKIN